MSYEGLFLFGIKGGESLAKKSELLKKQCKICKKELPLTSFYTTSSKLFPDGRIDICKIDLKAMLSDENDLKTFHSVLQSIDKPFLVDIYEQCKNSDGDTIGNYFRMINSLHQYKLFTWKDSVFDPKIDNGNKNQDNNATSNKTDEFIITQEIKDKWGSGYEKDDYRLFERKYNLLRRSYDEKTAMHSEGLKTYIRYRVKEEQATAEGDVRAAKEWGALAAKAATDAKLNVSQMSKADISGGVDVISQLFEAVESEVGIIPLLPKLLEQPYDDADLIIWATVNYNRRLEDKPSVAYRDIWNFYDEMLGEYFKQQGFDQKQIDEFKMKRNNVFRDLSDIYKEPLYESDGDK